MSKLAKLRSIANTSLLTLISEYLEAHPGIRFNQALSNLRINTEKHSFTPEGVENPPVIKDRYHEEPHHTIMRLIQESVLEEDDQDTDALTVGAVVKCNFERYGIITGVKIAFPWGFPYIVTFIGGDTTFIEEESEDFSRRHLTPMVFKTKKHHRE